MVDDHALHVALARDPERVLEVDERAGVGLGQAGLAVRCRADAEVDEQPGEHQQGLANHSSRVRPSVSRGVDR